MADSWRDAREGISGQRFRENIVELLERIAIALERQSPPVTLTPEESYLEPQGYRTDLDPVQADACWCGGDSTKTCTACSAARLAWVYSIRGDTE